MVQLQGQATRRWLEEREETKGKSMSRRQNEKGEEGLSRSVLRRRLSESASHREEEGTKSACVPRLQVGPRYHSKYLYLRTCSAAPHPCSWD